MKKKKINKTNVILSILLVLSASVFIYSLLNIRNWKKDNDETEKEVESIYKTAYQSDGAQVYIVDKLAAVSEVPASEKLLNHMMLEQMIDSLDETEKCLIRMRYYEDCTQTQVADKLGISQVQVSRLEKKILMRMRKNIDL